MNRTTLQTTISSSLVDQNKKPITGINVSLISSNPNVPENKYNVPVADNPDGSFKLGFLCYLNVDFTVEL
jgi:hypothetical protein